MSEKVHLNLLNGLF